MARQKVGNMFAVIAAITFSAAFLLAIGTIAWMFALYHDKMAAALLFRPIPDAPPAYHVRIARPRVVRQATRRPADAPSNALVA